MGLVMAWPVPVYTSAVTFLVGVPELWMAQRPRADGSHALAKGHLLIICLRLLAFYLGLALWFFEGNGWAGALLIGFSGLLYYVSFVAARTVDRSELTRGQRRWLLFSLGFPSTNFLFDVGGAFNPFEHFVLILLVVLAAAIAVVVFAVLEPMHKAYGCYPASVPWYELDKGLCPQYFGSTATRAGLRLPRGNVWRLVPGAAQAAADMVPPRAVGAAGARGHRVHARRVCQIQGYHGHFVSLNAS